MSVEVIAPTTSAATGEFRISASDVNATFRANGLAGAEKATLQGTDDDGATFYDLTDSDGNTIELSATNNCRTILGMGVYRVDKDATAASVGVYVSMQSNL